MSNRPKLYHVALTTAAKCRAIVLATSCDDAAFIAKTMLIEETFKPMPGVTVLEHHINATAVEADKQPEKYDATVGWMTHQTLKLMAHAREQAASVDRSMFHESECLPKLDRNDSRLQDTLAGEVSND